MMMKKLRTPVRGVVLIEALVALLIVTFGIIALGGLQATLTRGADLARQRGDALRIASSRMESLRTYSQFSGSDNSFTGIQTVPESSIEVDQTGSNTDFSLTSTIATSDGNKLPSDYDGILKAVRVHVGWKDRAGDAQHITLVSFISGADPALGFVLTQAADASLRAVASRNPGMPPSAKDLGGGKSVYKPAGPSTVALVFNNVTGVITSKCTVPLSSSTNSLQETDLTVCTMGLNGYLLSGTVGFNMNSPLTSDAAVSPAQPSLTLQLWLTSTHHALTTSYECYSDAPATPDPFQTRVRYDCVVYPNSDTPSIWSGYLDIAGLSFTGTNATRVCRYSADYDGDLIIGNAEHPLQYQKVAGNLLNQNFLVVSANVSCPAGHAVNAALGHFTNTATVNHQDPTTPSHRPPTP